MFTNKTRTALMAGAATLSLTVASLANEFSNVIVFGDRQLDAGQYVDDTTVFPENDEPVTTDGRGRFVNRDAEGNTGHTWATLVSRTLGHGDTNPSQPQTLPNSPPVETGLNFAAGFFDANDVLNSVDGFSAMNGIIYRNEEGVTRTVFGTERLGLLADPETAGWAAQSIVLMNGGAEDVRKLANVERGFDGTVRRQTPVRLNARGLTLVTDRNDRNAISTSAATNIAVGAMLMRDAGAGLVVVANMPDQGELPENSGEVRLATQGLAELDAAALADSLAPVSADDQRARTIFNQIIANPDVVSEYRSEGTNTYNARLSQLLDGSNDVVVIDQNALFAEMNANPARFGLEEVDQSDSCLFDEILFPCNEVDGTIEGRLYTDGLDLTTTAHAMIAQQTLAVIDAPVTVSGTPFMAMQSGRAVANAGRGQVAPERLTQRGWAPFVSGGIGQSTWNAVEGEGKAASQPLSAVGGVTYALGNGVAVGIAGGYQEIIDPTSQHGIAYTGNALYGTVFAGADFGRVFGNASATVGSVNYDSLDRRSTIGNATIENSGSTDADVFGASIEMGVRALTHGTIAAGPIASLDHWSADVAGYSEDGWAATAVSYDGFDASSTRASLGLFLEAGDLQDVDMPAVFRVKALYTRELNTDGVEVSARAASSPNNTFSREGRGAIADSITVGAQLSYDFGPLIGSIAYDARIGENDDHYGRIDISLPINGGV